MELYHYCMQNNEWKEEPRDIEDGLRSPSEGQTTAGSSY